MAKSYLEVLSWASSFLEKSEREGHAIEFLFLQQKNWTKTQWLLQMHNQISETDETLIAEDLKLLLADYPPQYILGFADFYDRRFKVTKDTLIPRPETEELVELCLKNNQTDEPKCVVDVGTGTGAIAVSLKLARPNWQVSAVDISKAALTIAKENAENLAAAVTFYAGDALEPIKEKIDILISNPPYISQTEWELMDESVRKFEPKTALFAANDGLAIYQQLAQEAKIKLKEDGQIFLEIGFRQGTAVKEIFQQAFPEKIVEIKKDMFGNERMIFVHNGLWTKNF